MMRSANSRVVDSSAAIRSTSRSNRSSETSARLEETGHRLASFAEHVGARMPSPDEASLLQLAEGVPVITVTRVAYREDGTPVEMNDMTLAADRYQLSYEWPAD
jgi:GntR family transcriptional regulator